MNSQPDLNKFRWIVVNSSGGKDSQTALREVVRLCDQTGIDRNRIVVSHQDLGRVEWKGTLELVRQQAAAYGLRVEVTRYRNKGGQELNLLDMVRNRGKWPSSTNRYCTSSFKRDTGARLITKLCKEASGDVLQVFGFRSQESPARAKKLTLALNVRLTSSNRRVWDWLPIHEWTEQQVWADIEASGVPYHRAYKLGMPRLSCCFCIFAPKAALMIAGQHNPELLSEYVKLESELGHTFQHGKPIADIQAALSRGEQPGAVDGNWNM